MADVIYCEECGEANQITSKFCSQCGSPVSSTTETTQHDSQYLPFDSTPPKPISSLPSTSQQDLQLLPFDSTPSKIISKVPETKPQSPQDLPLNHALSKPLEKKSEIKQQKYIPSISDLNLIWEQKEADIKKNGRLWGIAMIFGICVCLFFTYSYCNSNRNVCSSDGRY